MNEKIETKRISKLKWYLLGFASGVAVLVIVIAGWLAYCSQGGFTVELQSAVIPLPNGEKVLFTFDGHSDVVTLADDYVFTLLKNDGICESRIVPREFSAVSEFIVAASRERDRIWLIAPQESNWFEWNLTNGETKAHYSEPLPEYPRSNRFVYWEPDPN